MTVGRINATLIEAPLQKKMKIISGGQTGVDRAALDVALKHGIECGGWCPAGRLDELGRIPDRYPLKELEQGSFAQRTLQNVKDSDGTVIIYCRQLAGGTEFTLQCCNQLSRPPELIDAVLSSAEKAAETITKFVREHKIDILNVAGPRQSEWREGYDYAFRALEIFLNSIVSTSRSMNKRKRRIIRSAALSPDRGARRNRPGSARRKSKSKTR